MCRWVLILVALLLTGCATAESEAQAKAELEARDDASCRNHGYEPGTVKYEDCRARLDELRTQADRQAQAGRLLGRSPMQ
jgi:hypothetical protein